MLRIPHCLRQAVAWAFVMCQVDTPEVTISRSFQERLNFHHLLLCNVLPFYSCGLSHRFPDRVLPLEITRVFVYQAQEFLPQISPKFSLWSPGTAPRLFPQHVSSAMCQEYKSQVSVNSERLQTSAEHI